MIGMNIRMRRKKLKLSQQDLAYGDWTRSYISQIESGRIQPSIETLAKIASKLDTTVSNLIGDEILMQKAKAAVFYPDICKQILAQLPETTTTIFLYKLTNSLLTNKSLDCQLPPNAELYFLTARVLIFQKNYPHALQVLLDGMKYLDEFWRIIFLAKLHFVYQQLGKTEELNNITQQIAAVLNTKYSVDELRRKLTYELHFESNPVRSQNLISFIQAIDYYHEFKQAFQIINDNV